LPRAGDLPAIACVKAPLNGLFQSRIAPLPCLR